MKFKSELHVAKYYSLLNLNYMYNLACCMLVPLYMYVVQ